MWAPVLVLAILGLSFGGAQAQAAGDPGRGGKLFQQRCSVCHTADKAGAPGVGPNLYGAYGRKAGLVAGFAYSEKLKASGVSWSPSALDRWLQGPAGLVPGVKMAIAPVADPVERADLIAFLRQQSLSKK